ncbi:MAG: arginase family protein [Candidatus Heimdallarchaeaceae archaeon]
MNSSFLGFFSISDIESIQEKNSIILLGLPFEREKATLGSSLNAPEEIRKQSYEFSGISTTFNINASKRLYYDLGDINPIDEKDKIKKLWKTIQPFNSKLICLGGDHSITFDMLSKAPWDEKTAIVWIDAHADLANEYPPGVFCSHGTVFTNLKITNNLTSEQMFLIGGHAYTQTPEEFNKIQGKEITFLPTQQFFDNLENSLKKIEEFAQKFDTIYVSFDLDSLDQSFVPTLGTSEPFGLSPYILLKILHILLPKAQYIDIVETQFLKENRIVLDLVCGFIFYILEEWEKAD